MIKIDVIKLLLLFIVLSRNVSYARVIEKIVAIVNSEVILKSDLDNYLFKLKSEGSLIDDTILRMKVVPNLIKNPKELVDHIIEEQILASEVKRLNLVVPFEKVEQEIRSISSRNGMSREELQNALSKKGINFSDYQDFIRTSIERQTLIERELNSKIRISDEDIASYYINQLGDKKNTQIFEYTLAQILFLHKKDDSEVKERAQTVWEQVKKNRISFDKAASEYSEDPQFSQGGLLGSLKAGEMLPNMEAVVQTMPTGDTSLINTPAGWHIVKLIKKTLVPSPDFNANKDKIRAILYTQAFNKQLSQWIKDKKSEYFIRIN